MAQIRLNSQRRNHCAASAPLPLDSDSQGGISGGGDGRSLESRSTRLPHGPSRLSTHYSDFRLKPGVTAQRASPQEAVRLTGARTLSAHARQTLQALRSQHSQPQNEGLILGNAPAPCPPMACDRCVRLSHCPPMACDPAFAARPLARAPAHSSRLLAPFSPTPPNVRTDMTTARRRTRRVSFRRLSFSGGSDWLARS